MKLNLGACDRKFPGYLSVDIVPPADIVADLNEVWPWPDSSVEAIKAFDVFEHLECKRFTMNELWRVLVPGGRAELQIPHATLGDGGHCDPTHRSFWTQSDFEYFTFGDPHRERFRNYYGIRADFRVVNQIESGPRKGHIPMLRHERRYGGYVMEMQIILEAVK